MFARILESVPKLEKKEEFIRVLKNEVLPILNKQHGSWKCCLSSPRSRTRR